MSNISPPVTLRGLSLARSNTAIFLGASALSVGVVLSLPAAAAVVGIAIPTVVLTASKATVFTGILLTAVSIRHRFYYDVSLIHLIWVNGHGWHGISSDIILGSIPLTHQVEQIKKQGVTHVITLLEDFELERGIVHPATAKLWQKHGIKQFQIRVKDFYPVPAEKIRESVAYMHAVRKKNRRARFYIHCKAGVGRSCSIVVADRLTKCIQTKRQTQLQGLIHQEFQNVKKIRKQVKLSPKQQASILTYCINSKK